MSKTYSAHCPTCGYEHDFNSRSEMNRAVSEWRTTVEAGAAAFDPLKNLVDSLKTGSGEAMLRAQAGLGPRPKARRGRRGNARKD